MEYKKIRVYIFILFLFLFKPAFAEYTLEDKIIDAVNSGKKSVVNITTYRKGVSEEGVGSGVIISSKGYILTNTHVISQAENIMVTLWNEKKYPASIVRASADHDITILKINANEQLPVAELGNSDNLKLGQFVIAIGNPMHFSWTVTMGVVSALGRDITAEGIEYEDLIQTDAAINPGSSGGALLDTNGKVIGINTLVYTGNYQYSHAQGLSFAIPINYAIKIAKLLIANQTKATPKPWLGITGTNLTGDMAMKKGYKISSGVIVITVMAESPAAQGGLIRGDIITGANGRVVRTTEDLKRILNEITVGSKIPIEYYRNNEKNTVYTVIVSVDQ